MESNMHEISGHAILGPSPSCCSTALPLIANVRLNIERESTDVMYFLNTFFYQRIF